MNKAEWVGQCVAILEGMPSNQPMAAAMQIYAMAFDRMGEEYSIKAVQAASLDMGRTWRPSPGELIGIACDIASPLPSPDSCYEEIMDKASRLGVCAMDHPERPSIKLFGPPTFSHPIVSSIVSRCGGWQMICEGEANMQGGLRKQVEAAHGSLSKDWREQVAQQLNLPAEKREARLFGRYKPNEVITPAAAEPEFLGSAPAVRQIERPKEGVPMPAELRAMFKTLRQKVEMPDEGTKAAEVTKAARLVESVEDRRERRRKAWGAMLERGRLQGVEYQMVQGWITEDPELQRLGPLTMTAGAA